MNNIIKIELVTGEIIETEWENEFDVEMSVEEIYENKFYQYDVDKYISTDHIVKFEVY